MTFQLLERLPVVSHADFFACGEGSTVMKVEMTARRRIASLHWDQWPFIEMIAIISTGLWLVDKGAIILNKSTKHGGQVEYVHRAPNDHHVYGEKNKTNWS